LSHGPFGILQVPLLALDLTLTRSMAGELAMNQGRAVFTQPASAIAADSHGLASWVLKATH